MSGSNNGNSGNDNDNSNNRYYQVFWDNEFEKNGEDRKRVDTIMLKELIGKRIKVWSAFTITTGGTRGHISGTSGTLTHVDDEFICLDNAIYLSRKFISRIELI